MYRNLLNRKILGVRLDELLAFLAFYLFFALSYYVTLWINRLGFQRADDPLFSVNSFFDSGGLDYLLKLLLTIPLWWLIFRKLKHWRIKNRLLLHIFFLPFFVIVWQQIYYAVSDFYGLGHLRGAFSVWDNYIPGLFYVLQFGILHAYNYFKENQRKLLLEGELRQAALKSELSAIKAQLNPHFLYNIFNTINASVPPEQEKTRKLIAELSDLFRYQLQASRTELVPLEEELAFVKKYLDLEKERFGDRLSINIQVDKEAMEEKVPPMILQPLVENSVKHGLATLIEGGEIEIKIQKRGGKLWFQISDTGIGIQDKETALNSGVGLSNTRLRLEKMYQSKLRILDNTPKGLKIEFSI
ncbi:sensor histidine kinase [Ascidiimonas sp. W6]|uniref:sensor histidine kinase n=1 Tax=Ascidiimonas meishanensis TaxID=3128903 RepID=UPI0030ED6D49